MTKFPRRALQTFKMLAGSRCRADHTVGMAADIFGRRHDGDVHSRGYRGKKERRRPRVVEQGYYLTFARNGADRRYVLDLHCQRSWALEQDGTSSVADEAGHVSPDQRIVITGSDAEPLENGIAESAGGAVNTIGDEHLVPRCEN